MTEPDLTNSDDAERRRDPIGQIEHVETRLKALRTSTPENPFHEVLGPTPVPSTFKTEQDPAQSYAESSRAIGRGFEIYAHVITGSLMIMIPAVLGYFLDQRLELLLFAPLGVILGMISGLSYLLRMSNRKPRD